MSTGCGNEFCSEGCCCYCENRDNCYMCKFIKCGSNAARTTRCRMTQYPFHFICFDCKHGWKECRVDAFCNFCKNRGTRVSTNTRIPKRTATKHWELLRKLTFCSEFYGCSNDKLGSLWVGVGTGFHMAPEIRRLIWTPTKPRDYKRWVEYMKTTKIP